MSRIRLFQFHPYDPSAIYVGGVGTVIRSLIKFAPADFDLYLVGVSTDPQKYPVGRWHQLELSGRTFHFLPVMAADTGRRPRIPLTLKFVLALWRHRRLIDLDGALLEFHRIETSLLFRARSNAKVLFLHGHHGKDYYNGQSEVKWARFPALYFWLERRLITHIAQVYIVREDAIAYYRERYPSLRDCIQFIPTWVDQTIFNSLHNGERVRLKAEFSRMNDFDGDKKLLLYVGRFVGQKDPMLLLRAYRELLCGRDDTIMVMIGSGALEPAMQDYVQAHQLAAHVRILSPLSHAEISQWMNAADCLCLSSAFEGMPLVLLEALQCGLPVISTDAGEAARLIPDERIGRLVKERSAGALRHAIEQVLAQSFDRDVCRERVQPYTAAKVLGGLHSRYRQIVGKMD